MLLQKREGPMFNLIRIFLFIFAIPSLVLFVLNYKKIPSVKKEETTDSREFWMFIGALVFFLSAMFIIAKTSTPVINAVFGTKLAPPEDIEFSYNKVIVLIAIIIGILSAITQYFKYKSTPLPVIFKKDCAANPGFCAYYSVARLLLPNYL
jgi:cytochrome c-type biogenesis protein CcmF